MPYSFQGIGTEFIGERDFAPDGSYVTTEWFVFLAIPVFPIRSLRVIQVPDFSGSAFTLSYPVQTIRESFQVLETSAPCLKQVLSVYGFVFFLAAWYTSACWFAIKNRFSEGLLIPYVAIMLGLPWGLPWLLRRRAKARVGQTSYSQQAGNRESPESSPNPWSPSQTGNSSKAGKWVTVPVGLGVEGKDGVMLKMEWCEARN